MCVATGDDDKVSIGAGVRFGTMGVQIRGYVKSENSLDAAEDLADDIEFVINTLSIESSNATFQIVDARVDSIETDEGLFEPFGVVNIGVTISYEQAETV